jgi:predicted patatin/cPLA2 family phospholipase
VRRLRELKSLLHKAQRRLQDYRKQEQEQEKQEPKRSAPRRQRPTYRMKLMT